MQDWILDGSNSSDLILERLLTARLVVISLVKNLILIDVATFFGNALPTQDFHADNVVFVKLFSPALWDSILNLVLDHDLVWTFSEGLGQ